MVMVYGVLIEQLIQAHFGTLNPASLRAAMESYMCIECFDIRNMSGESWQLSDSHAKIQGPK